jgi:uncharacterized protein YndB with AHSA1/START domain
VSEISLDVDLPHPPERIWRALTDRRLLDEWFMQSDMEPREGATFRAFPLGIAGFTGPFEIDLIEVAAPRRIRLRMRGEQLHADMTWDIEPQEQGSRLRVSQSGFLGVNGTLRRRELRRSYHRLFAEALPAILERIAAGEVDLGGGSVEALHTAIPRQRAQQHPVGTAKVPVRPVAPLSPLGDSAPLAREDDRPPVTAAAPAPTEPLPRRAPSQQLAPPRRRRRGLAILVTSAMVAALLGWLWATRPRASDPVAGEPIDVPRIPGQAVQPGDGVNPTPLFSVAPSPGSTGGVITVPGSSGSPAPGSSSGPNQPTPTPSAAASAGSPVPLTAGYSTETSHGLLGIGYVAKVTTTVRNPGTVAHTGWTMVMTIPDGAELDNKSPNLVTITISGGTVTISVAGDGKVVFVFQFSGGSLLGLGTGSVTSCTIDGKQCSAS